MKDAGAIFEPMVWTGDGLRLIDQRRLPDSEEWIECRDARDAAAAIRDMVVRGAPAIGVTAAFGMALAALRASDAEVDVALREAAATIRAARPTAQNLFWAVDRMERRARDAGDPDERRAALVEEAVAIHREDVAACRSMGRFGAELVPPEGRILTQCNAGSLATGGYGTALGVVRAVREAGRPVRVFAPETRPYLQGARLTAWELQKDGIDVVVVTDNAVGQLLSRGEVSCAVVGADRVAANGDTANKIGTYSIAVLCEAHGVPFFVAAPVSTVDLAAADGAAIPIEERSGEEVAVICGRRVVPDGVAVRHPAFDVTPARLVSAIVTERGVARPPYLESLARLCA